MSQAEVHLGKWSFLQSKDYEFRLFVPNTRNSKLTVTLLFQCSWRSSENKRLPVSSFSGVVGFLVGGAG